MEDCGLIEKDFPSQGNRGMSATNRKEEKSRSTFLGGSVAYKAMGNVVNLCFVVSLRTVATLAASSHFFPVIMQLSNVIRWK